MEIHYEAPAVRDDLTAAHARYWRRLGLPGASWSGTERVAIARETRSAHAALLRESGSASGAEVNARALADPAIESGVPHGRALLEYASAVVGRDDTRLSHAREALRAEMGDAGVADAAAVASNFERMVRIADSIGIELGDWMESFTEAVRTDPRARPVAGPARSPDHDPHPTGIGDEVSPAGR